MIQIILKGRIPSKKNSKYVVVARGRPFFIPSPNYQAWHKEQMMYLKRVKTKFASAKVTITLYPPDKRKGDLTNKAESIMDLLVDSGILEDDNWFCVDSIILKFGAIDTQNPRAVIDLE